MRRERFMRLASPSSLPPSVNRCLLNTYFVSDIKDPTVAKTCLCPQGVPGLEGEDGAVSWELPCGIASSLLGRSSEGLGTTEGAPNAAWGI